MSRRGFRRVFLPERNLQERVSRVYCHQNCRRCPWLTFATYWGWFLVRTCGVSQNELEEALRAVAPGTAIREALDNIVRAKWEPSLSWRMRMKPLR